MAKHKSKGSGNRKGRRPSGGAAARARRAGADHRPLRVGEMIRKELVDIFASGAIHDPGVQNATITVTEVRPAHDLSNAVVYVMPFGGDEVDAMMEGLQRSGGLIRSLLASRISMRHVPGLQFKLDTSFQAADRIDALLASPNVARDLSHDTDDGSDTGSQSGNGSQSDNG